MVISVVIPCYYSEAMIAKVVTLTRDEFEGEAFDYEFILVNDGSTDGTFSEIQKLCENDKKIVGINCAKNYGQHNALMAGLRRANGDYVLLMDDDMQTHPSQCMKLVNAIMTGDFDIVFASWKSRQGSWWRKLGSNFAALSMRHLAHRPKEVFFSNFLIMRKFVCQEIARYNGPYIQIQGLALRATQNVGNVEVEHFDRDSGKSGYTIKSLVKMWTTVLNFSMVPLRAASILGPIIGLIGVVSSIVIIIQKIINPEMSAGWPSLMAVLLICSGLILITLGVMGEYLGRIFMMSGSEPQYVVRQVIDNRNDCANDS